MINVIVPIIDKSKKFDDILKKLSGLEDISVFVGVVEDLYNDFILKVGESDNIEIIKFQKGSRREEIINALQNHVLSGSIMVMRRPITFEEFNKFITSKKDVVTCRREMNKFQAFIFVLWQRILKFFLGLRIYDGDPSVIYVNADISSVTAASVNLSFSTRANRWRGIEQDVVNVKGDNVKFEYDKKDIIIYSVVAALLFITAITVTTCVSVFVNVGIITGILLISLDLICISVAFILFVIMLFNLVVGKKMFRTAIELHFESEMSVNDEDEVDEEDNVSNENDVEE